MKRYSQEEDNVILQSIKECSSLGAPLNLQRALADARKQLWKQLRKRRTHAAVVQRWYSYLRKEYRVFGYKNMKSLSAKALRKTVSVNVSGKEYYLTPNIKKAPK